MKFKVQTDNYNNWWAILPLLWYIQNSNLKQALKMQYEGKFSSKAVKKRFVVPSVEEMKKVEAVCKIVDNIYNVAKGLFNNGRCEKQRERKQGEKIWLWAS